MDDIGNSLLALAVCLPWTTATERDSIASWKVCVWSFSLMVEIIDDPMQNTPFSEEDYEDLIFLISMAGEHANRVAAGGGVNREALH